MRRAEPLVKRRFPSGLRVGFAVGVQQLRGVHVGVALRRAEARVTKEFLDGAQIGAGFEQVRGERVA